MGYSRHSNLWSGYGDYEVRRGTLVASTVTTLTFSDDIVSVAIEHMGAVANDIYVTLDGTTPTVDGSGDTGFKMLRVKQNAKLSVDKSTKTVKLISAGVADFQVIGLRG